MKYLGRVFGDCTAVYIAQAIFTSNAVAMKFSDLQLDEVRRRTRQINTEASAAQDAGKLLRGFEEFDPLTTGRRGVWELIQNACDLSTQCEVTIDFRQGSLAFSHNGTPFTTETLTYLIKQSSSKSRQLTVLESDDRPPVGRYGTGFITTHAYGRRLWLNGSMRVLGLGDKDVYLELQDFLLDRSERKVGALTTALAKQLMAVEDLPSQVSSFHSTPAPATTFRYQPETSAEQDYVRQAWESLLVNVPYVMAINETLHLVRLLDEDGVARTFRKGPIRQGEGCWLLPITCDEREQVMTCLYEPYSPVQIIAPLGADAIAFELGQEVPRLFLYFPLIGTERWGCDFVVHADTFEVRNARDGVHLQEKDQTQEQVSHNQALLRAASEKIFVFLEGQLARIEQPLKLAHVRFTADDREDEKQFREQIQELWRERLARLPLVETESGERLPPSESYFLGPDLLSTNVETQAAIYHVASLLWPGKLPKAELVHDWAQTLQDWGRENTNWIRPAELAAAIEAHRETPAFDSSELLRLYEHLKAQGFGELFKQHALLPNQRGNLVKFDDKLLRSQDLHAPFMQVLESVVPQLLDQLLDERFTVLETPPALTRRLLSQRVNEEVGRLLAANNSSLPEQVCNGLLLLCSVFPSEAPAVKSSLRWQLLPWLYQFYGLAPQQVFLANVVEAEEIRYEEQPLRNVVRQFFYDFEVGYAQAGPAQRVALREVLRECLELLSKNSDMRKEMLTVAVLPNQLNELCIARDLVIEKGFGPQDHPEQAEQLKRWAQQITGADYRKELVNPDFEEILRRLERPEQDGKALAVSLEAKLVNQHQLEEINSHPKRAIILDIIKHLSDGWGGYFLRINSQRATITLNRMTNEELKESLFGIITLPEHQIEDLGELAKSEHFAEVLTRAQELVADRVKQAELFAFKKMLGAGIEELVHRQLQQQLQNLEVAVVVVNEQNGQDLIVRVGGVEVYQIEVKSLWDPKSSTILSYRQSSEAVENATHYALCSVDLTQYYPTDGTDRHDIKNIQQIEKHIRFVADIGQQISPLVSGLKRVEGKEDEVRLADQFRVIVPRRITKAGQGLEEFTKHLTAFIRNATAL